jgi:5-methylcytosine-specific restriction endonuclease McrA
MVYTFYNTQNRIPKKINTSLWRCILICSYCGNAAEYILKNGNPCCFPKSNSCQANRVKNANGLRKAHALGKMRYDQLSSGHGWNKGKTAFSDGRIKCGGQSGRYVFCNNSDITTARLKKIIHTEGIKPYCCEECGNNGVWRGKPITLELDHINGDTRDNRLENLRFMCPNCHTQTPTYKNKNKHNRTNDVSDRQLLESLKSNSSIYKALQQVGLSGSGNYKRAYKIMFKNAQNDEVILINSKKQKSSKKKKAAAAVPRPKKIKPLCKI